MMAIATFPYVPEDIVLTIAAICFFFKMVNLRPAILNYDWRLEFLHKGVDDLALQLYPKRKSCVCFVAM